MKRFAAVLLGLLAVSSMVAADPLYKWVDSQGNVHYSDKPQPGATKIVLPKASTFNPPAVATPPTGSDAPRRPDSSPDRDQPAETGYTGISISAPADQATVWNTDTITVNVAVTPALSSGDSVTITLDSQTQTVQGTSAKFAGLERGPHTVTATVGGIKATPITFYIQKTSIIKPPSALD